jgi:hypothetical protein
MGLAPELQPMDRVDINSRQAIPAKAGRRNLGNDISCSKRNERTVFWDQTLKL